MSGMRHSRAWIKVDGKLLETMPGAKLKLGGFKQSPVVGDNAMLGYSQAFEPGGVECEVSLGKGTSLAELQAIRDATLTYEADTGQVYQVNHAFVTDALELTAGDGGKVKLMFAGDPAQEMGV